MAFQKITLMEGRCSLDALAEKGEETASAWIFLNVEEVRRLSETADSKDVEGAILKLGWEETDMRPAEHITLRARSLKPDNKWYELVCSDAGDIAFKTPASDPKEIFFITTWDAE